MSMDVNLSALSAHASVHQVAANNIANVNTDGFQASRANLESGPSDQGVRVASLTRDTSPGAVFEGRETSNVDLGREMVSMMTTENAYAANASVVRANDEMTGYLLNMMV
ncbi:flagellar basal body rod C-terminal domain-containing protein [Salidesulfovibrio onnuriiensis]|uniref:flagellar basal body rod C-terminal domain-containing protein n=1 Tax=Salidesulfovibrio onnuriiensis TaxID=2583823 RepID=UPI0011C883CE|nr:flagellar basal body rod C-terminal domain-containing protein [Salidesulfovibrio onnuriiensis]